ncbi:helix-turn-helix domain-containing protein [Tamlana sp. 2201CG12-4]|uniref:helix-turn-helix domain-containing protein n=1 Tax=Tamlana sp. 2201CG12-4 TaxID=3112582 RepID=UPI002DBAF83F|nr:helix-turn-helix domain-containing protein [Tamlana sp. 2201CG12-4]MEC3908733.1 helix-turn-helix domain-containing protein [Tamlana sp. 2201CG12-4]
MLSFQVLGLFLAGKDIAIDFFQNINCVYGFLYGPLLFMYSKSITEKDFKLKPQYLYHFALSLIVLTTSLIFGKHIVQNYIYILYPLHILTYLILCFLELAKYKKAIKDNYSKLESLSLNWLKWVLIIFSFTTALDVIQSTLFFLNIELIPTENFVFILILLIINILYFKGFMSSNNLIGLKEEDIVLSQSMSSRKRLNTTLKENQIIVNKLEDHIKETRTFENPDLTITTLSQELGIPKRTLSELINDYYDKNFVDFINTHRIIEAKRRFMNPKDNKETILEVMYSVGFNSKSSFNTAFKRKTGLTPTEFKSKYK